MQEFSLIKLTFIKRWKEIRPNQNSKNNEKQKCYCKWIIWEIEIEKESNFSLNHSFKTRVNLLH